MRQTGHPDQIAKNRFEINRNHLTSLTFLTLMTFISGGQTYVFLNQQAITKRKHFMYQKPQSVHAARDFASAAL
jgi:hypothetical protein